MQYLGSTAKTVSAKWVRVPVYNQIAAGLPLTDCEIIGKRRIRVPERLGNHFCAVRVTGDSLLDANIANGDFAIVRLTPELDYNGQLAAVLTPDGLVLKYTWFEGRRVRLQSKNRRYRDRYLPIDEVEIQGVVIRTERDHRRQMLS